MTQQELYKHLKSLGLPVAYSEFINTEENPAPSPPFITYQFAYNSDIKADNQNYINVECFQIELYTIAKDLVIEKFIQDKLKELRLPYSKIETWIQSEKLRQVLYEIQIIGG